MRVICPHCLSVNNIPQKDSYNKANCGKCKKSLLDTKLVKLSNEKSSNKKRNLNMNEISVMINSILKDVAMDANAKALLIQNLELTVSREVDLSSLKTKLEILYSYEKNYLELVKEFKEEIKFASSIQEDLRKERAKFFAETLKEVQSTLKASQVESEVASTWIKELVSSYTKSLDLSSGLIEENTLDTIGRLRKESKQEVKKADLN